MRVKSVFLLLLIVLPLAVIGFLYLFGNNQYVVKGNRLAGRALPHLALKRDARQVEVIGLTAGRRSAEGMAGRVSSRVVRIGKESGPLKWVRLDDSSQVRDILYTDLGLPTDTGGEGFWYLLLDKNGRLANVYDLRQERLLDTLAIEASILAGQNQ